MQIKIENYIFNNEGEKIDLSLPKKGIVKISGTGADKLALSLIGAKSKYSGEIIFDDKNIKSFSNDDWTNVRRNQITIADSFIGDFKKMKLLNFSKSFLQEEQITKFENLLNEVGIIDYQNKKIQNFTKEERDVIALIFSMASDKEAIIITESKMLERKVSEKITNLVKKHKDEFLFVICYETVDSLTIEIEESPYETDRNDSCELIKKKPKFLPRILQSVLFNIAPIVVFIITLFSLSLLSLTHLDYYSLYETFFNETQEKVIQMNITDLSTDKLDDYKKRFNNEYIPVYEYVYQNIGDIITVNNARLDYTDRSFFTLPSGFIITDTINSFSDILEITMGNLPSNENEMVLTEYQLELFKTNGIKTLNNGDITNTELNLNPEKIIGSQLDIGFSGYPFEVTISGVLNTGFNMSEYKEYFDYRNHLIEETEENKEMINEEREKYVYNYSHSLFSMHFMPSGLFEKLLQYKESRYSDGYELTSMFFKMPKGKRLQRILEKDCQDNNLRLYAYGFSDVNHNANQYKWGIIDNLSKTIVITIMSALSLIFIVSYDLNKQYSTFRYIKEIGCLNNKKIFGFQVMLPIIQTILAYPLSLLLCHLYLIKIKSILGLTSLSIIVPLITYALMLSLSIIAISIIEKGKIKISTLH